MEGVLVSGNIRGRAVGECVRCLEEVVEERRHGSRLRGERDVGEGEHELRVGA